MKVLCICQYSHSRSVGLARCLHAIGISAVAIGWATNGGAIVPLSEWADVIALMTPEAMGQIPFIYQEKVTTHFDIGPDKWSNPYSQDMLHLLQTKVQEYLTLYPRKEMP